MSQPDRGTTDEDAGVLTREAFDAFAQKVRDFKYRPDEHPEEWVLIGMRDIERFPAVVMIEREEWQKP